jgi:hypothetical protein
MINEANASFYFPQITTYHGNSTAYQRIIDITFFIGYNLIEASLKGVDIDESRYKS